MEDSIQTSPLIPDHDATELEVMINQQQSNSSSITVASIPKLMPERKSKKRRRESQFTFMIKSEVDILDDGHTWRKFGQKVMLNSPYPRNYYKCTTKSCNVRKTVGRCLSDHSIVEIIYRGKHIHPSPHLMLPGPTSSSSSGLHEPPPIQQPAAAAASPAFSSADTAAAATNLARPVPLVSTPLMINSVNYISPTTRAAFEKISCIHPSVLLKDHGTTTSTI